MSTKTTPFKAVYGYQPPHLLQYTPGIAKAQAIEEALKDRNAALRIIKDNLREAKERMKKFSDLKRTERNFQIGEWVYLRLKPYCQLSVATRQNQKLAHDIMDLL